jgi:hypothetical protein
MKTILLFPIVLFSFISIQSCDNTKTYEDEEAIILNKTGAYMALGDIEPDYENPTPEQYANNKGYWENGQLITNFDCPDSRFFPPIDIKLWDKTPVVNGRFPTYAETMKGISIHHYGEKKNSLIKPYEMTLPKLAYCYNPSTGRQEIVVVIQIVQTAKDTVVGYRYLTGGVGGSVFHNFRFLTDDEVKIAILK